MEERQATAAWYAGPDEGSDTHQLVVSFWLAHPWRQYVAAVDEPGSDVVAAADGALKALGAARVGEWSKVELHRLRPAADDVRRLVNTSMTCQVRPLPAEGAGGLARSVPGTRVIAPAQRSDAAAG